MDRDKEVKFRCMIIDVNRKNLAEKGPEKGLEMVQPASGLLKAFSSKIRHDFEIEGEITVCRSKKDSDPLAPGREITDHYLRLTEGETIFVLYNNKVKVVPGGYGEGAKGSGQALAMGGFATGGAVTAKGMMRGGDGIGGDLIGEYAVGTAGGALGGQVYGGTAGDAAGGEVVHRAPKSERVA